MYETAAARFSFGDAEDAAECWESVTLGTCALKKETKEGGGGYSTAFGWHDDPYIGCFVPP